VNHGFVDIAELLLKSGAMVNVPGCHNITPLHEAVMNNRLDIVKLLVMYGADAEVRDVSGMTPRYVQ
jgi:tankyrase